jgi:hypothetical protein
MKIIWLIAGNYEFGKICVDIDDILNGLARSKKENKEKVIC